MALHIHLEFDFQLNDDEKTFTAYSNSWIIIKLFAQDWETVGAGTYGEIKVMIEYNEICMRKIY